MLEDRSANEIFSYVVSGESSPFNSISDIIKQRFGDAKFPLDASLCCDMYAKGLIQLQFPQAASQDLSIRFLVNLVAFGSFC